MIGRAVVVLGVAGAMAAHSGVSAEQRSPDLDITAINLPAVEDPAVEEPAPSLGELVSGRTVKFVGPGSAEGQAPPRSPLRVRLIRVEPSTCVLGEPTAFDVELQNIGSTPLALPWSADPRDEGDVSQVSQGLSPAMSLSLNTQRTDGSHILGDVSMLYADRFVPVSVRVLHPRDTVVVRAASVCAIGIPGTVMNGSEERVSVRVRVELKARHDYAGLAAVSSEAVVLTVLNPAASLP